MPIDCTAPPIIAAFQGDAIKCQLIVACQARLAQTGVPIPADVKSACDKALADWKSSETARAATIIKPQDDTIRSLMKK